MSQASSWMKFSSLFSEKIVTHDSRLAGQVHSASQCDQPVLILGPTGTGKELVAKVIHESGLRSAKPLVVVNCALIPKELLYAELFGVETGAYTGAKRRSGRFEEAHKGTLFLDEIGDLPADAQAGLLRVLETSEIRRLGGEGKSANKTIDVRILAATNKDITNPALFRADLYYRLKVLPIQLKSLRSRTDEIPPLLRRFLLEADVEAIDFHLYVFCLINSWEGNVRELQNFCRNASLCGGYVEYQDVVEIFYEGGGRKTLGDVEDYFIDNVPNIFVNSELEEDVMFWPPDKMSLNPQDFRYRRFLRDFQMRIAKSKSQLKWDLKIRPVRIYRDPRGRDKVKGYFYPRIGVKDIPTEDFQNLEWEWDEHEKPVGSEAYKVLHLTLNVLHELERFDLPPREGREGEGSQEHLPVEYNAAMKDFHEKYYSMVFGCYGNRSDDAIAKKIGQDGKTVKKKRRLYSHE